MSRQDVCFTVRGATYLRAKDVAGHVWTSVDLEKEKPAATCAECLAAFARATMNGQDLYKKLMDLDLILGDVNKMVALRVFLDSVRDDHRALVLLAREVDMFHARLDGLMDAALAHQRAIERLSKEAPR